MFLGFFLPLALVCGFALIVTIVVAARELRMIKRAFVGTPQAKPQNRSLKEQSLEELINARKPYKRNSPTKPPLIDNEEVQRSKVFEREEDERWLAEISSNLDPAVEEEMDLLDTARSLLQLANDKQRSAKRSSDHSTRAYPYQQKEFYKKFVEKKLSDLISTREGIRSR